MHSEHTQFHSGLLYERRLLPGNTSISSRGHSGGDRSIQEQTCRSTSNPKLNNSHENHINPQSRPVERSNTQNGFAISHSDRVNGHSTEHASDDHTLATPSASTAAPQAGKIGQGNRRATSSYTTLSDVLATQTAITPTIKLSDALLRDFDDYSDYRAMWRLNWSRYCEESEYVKEERRQMANLVAQLQHALVSFQSTLVTSGLSELDVISAKIKDRGAALVQAQEKLDTLMEDLTRTEKLVRAAEQRVRAGLRAGGDIEAAFDTAMVLPVSSSTNSQLTSSEEVRENVRDLLEEEPQTLSSASFAQADIPANCSASTKIDGGDISSNTPYTYMRPKLDNLDRSVVSNMLSTKPTKPLQTNDFDVVTRSLGVQFNDCVAEDANDMLLNATTQQIIKRKADLASVMNRAVWMLDFDELYDTDYSFPTRPDHSNPALDGMLHIFRRSWLEFAQFMHSLGSLGDFSYVKKVDFMDYDTKLKQSWRRRKVQIFRQKVPDIFEPKHSSLRRSGHHSPDATLSYRHGFSVVQPR